MSQAWKAHERRKCAELGLKRRGQVAAGGWARGSDNDDDGPVSLQCKYTTRYQLRRKWVEQARADSKQDGRPWVLAIDEHNDRSRGLAVMDWDTFLVLYRAAFAPLGAAGSGSRPPAVTPFRSSS